MCGIVAELSPAGVSAEALAEALAVIAHRGPDGRGAWISPDRVIGLAHARLAIIDRAGSPQPIISEDGQVVVAVNGEFYGYESIRHDLQGRGHRFATGGDSEIAVHLYEEHGLGFLDHLRGEFALVLWDGRTRRLIAARDRFGIKPLCYAEHRGRLLLASEAKALFVLGVAPRWDEESFWQVAGMQYPLAERTMFAGVRMLPPGGCLIATNNEPRVSRYQDMDYPREPRPAMDAHEAAAELRAQLTEAVRLRLRAETPICFHLSGGLDSSSIVALARRELGLPIDCFTVGFTGAGYDEREQAGRTAAALGVRLQVIALDEQTLWEGLSDAVYFSEGLAINAHLAAKFLLSRAIRRAGFAVVLSGEGSDEILAGYAHLRQDALPLDDAGRETLRRRNALLAGIHLPLGEQLPVESVRRRLGFVPTFLQAKASLGYRLHGLLREDFRLRFAGRDALAIFLGAIDVAGQLEGRHRVDQSSYLWTRSALATSILRTLGDGAEMAHAVEGRLPFLDHHLFAHARQIPVALKTDGIIGKRVLRDAMRDMLPGEVCEREKMPFTAPPWRLGLTETASTFLSDWLHSGALAEQPFFDPQKLRSWAARLVQGSESERIAGDPVLMLALTATLLHQRFGL
jgi:asparagine synthase (glutamine-hydrolysing)